MDTDLSSFCLSAETPLVLRRHTDSLARSPALDLFYR